jgi:UDP-N-acetylmuramyl pentapeptide phosphotransferase/UDP-N-acetylglucosamine-1-phosphate transferase
MIPVALLLAATLVVSGWLTGRLAAPGAWLRILDTPNARSLHATAMPRTGGVAILGGFVFGLVLCLGAARMSVGGSVLAGAARDLRARDVFAIVAAALALGAVSLWGDRREISPGVRLAAQCLAAAVLIWPGDFVIPQFYVPFVGVVVLGRFAYPLTLLFIVWMTNLYNFMDGMDGFAGGMALIGFGFFGWLALFEGAAGLGLLGLLLAAAAGGFLIFNYPPARIFMGDVGAVPLGFLAATLAIKGSRENVMGLWVPIIIFSPFIVDATIVLIRRGLRGAKVWEPHREHYYQRLVLAGWSHRKTVVVEYLVMLGWGIVAVLYEWRGEVGHVVVLALGVVVYTLLALGVGLVERRADPRRGVSRAG